MKETVFAVCVFIATMFSAWLTHIIVSIKAGAWLLLIAGGVVPPVGIIHGIASWFGYSWV